MQFSQQRWAGSHYRPSFFRGFSFFPPVIKFLLVSNAVLWLLLDIFLAPFTLHNVPIFVILTEYLALWPLGHNFWPWQLLTYMFIHGGFWHLFFNMLALWMFGTELEHGWGSKRFALFYLACGIGGGITNLLVAPLLGQAAPTVGASGAVFGVLLAFGVMFPERPIYLYFLLPIKAKYFIAFYILLELFFGVTGTSDGVAHFAHLGGAATGLFFVLAERDVIPLRRLWSALRSSRAEATSDPSRFSRSDDVIQDAKFYDIHSGKPLDDEDITQEMVDEILDKIGREGYQSLTDREKQILTEASKKIH